jgi:hypothetical protein
LTAIHQAPSWPALRPTHSSPNRAICEKSGENTQVRVPLCRASSTKCASGVRVTLTFEPTTAISFALYQSADSWTSVCSPQVSGDAFGRSQYQS